MILLDFAAMILLISILNFLFDRFLFISSILSPNTGLAEKIKMRFIKSAFTLQRR